MTPYLSILKLVWPLALGMINNAVMQFVDRAYLAQHSMAALEAVLPAGTLAWIFMGFFQSVVGYSGVFVAQYHGAGDRAMCRACYRAALGIAGVAGLLMLPLVPAGDLILAGTAPSPTLLELEREYYDIVAAGSVFVYVQTAASSYFTGRGLTRIVFWVNLAGNLLNVALDPFLIFGWCGFPRLGIVGAACATVVSVAVQAMVLAATAYRHGSAERVSGSLDLVRRILRFGIPAGFYEVLNMASFAIFVFVTGGVGDVALAASNACFAVNYLLFAPMTGFALGAQTLVGQARGRGDDREAKTAFRRTLVLALGLVVAAGGLLLLFRRPILALFAPTDVVLSAEFHALGTTLLFLMSAWMLFDAVDVVVSGALKGAGDTKFVMWWMLVCAFLFWMPVVFAVRRFHNTMPALWATMVLYVVVICIGSLVRWYRGKWTEIALV
ncbi:MAG: MATE family efflux transporter [Kiritimatiellia bacterium]